MHPTRRLIPAAALTALLLSLATPGVAQPTPAAPQTHQFSRAQLKAAHLSLDKRLVKAPAGITSWGEDPVSGRLVVSVVASDQGAMAKAKAAVADVPAAQIKPVVERVRPYWNVIGGQAIFRSGARCSAGFNARDAAGARYVLTAGHCTELGGTWSGAGGTIGSVAGTAFPRDDYGRIRVSSSAAASTALVDRYSSGSDVTVAEAAIAVTGTAVCRSGSTTGWRCGSVTGVNQTVNYGGGDIVYGLTRTSACAQPGDSGGSYVTNPGRGTGVNALGLLSGGSGNCSSGGTTFYQPISEVLSVYRLSLVTG
jgi:streptogrisin C